MNTAPSYTPSIVHILYQQTERPVKNMSIINGIYNERCEILADYLIKNRETVRGAALRFGVSKSTVYKDVTEKLKRVNPSLYEEVKELLDLNKSERHLRGGEATRQKYRLKKLGGEITSRGSN